MIEKMTRYSFIVYSGDREEFLNTIQEQGVIDIKRSEKAVDEKSVQMFQRIAAAREDMETIRKGVDAHLIALRTEEKALEDRLEQTIPWGNFEKDKIEALADHGINLHFYCVPAKSFKKEWPEEYPLEVVSDTGSHVYFVTAGECDIPAKEIPMPSANADELQVMLDAKRNEIDRYAASLEARKSELPRLESLVKDTISELNVYLAGVTGEDAAEGSICVFEGYAPEADRERLCAVFDGMDIYYEAHDATLEDNPPIKLRNNRFAGLFESITRMYGMPVYDEFDPTPLLAIFFLLFFAMCMGDAGYGILLVLIGWGISKGKLKIAMFDGLGPIILVLGVAWCSAHSSASTCTRRPGYPTP